jgi:hypothetical protein
MPLHINNTYLVYIYAIFIAAIAYLINLLVKGPMIQGDEGSYLANAAAIAGFPNDMFGKYHAGYSILISPAFLFVDGSEHIWSFIKAINAMLLGSVFFLIYKINEIILPSSSHHHRIITSLLVGIYPMWVTLSGYSFSENAFVPAFLLATFFYLKALKEGEVFWILSGLAIGFLYWIHPKSVIVLLAFFASLVFLGLKEKKVKGQITALAALVLMILLYRYGFLPWLQEKMLISGQQPASHYPGLKSMLAHFDSLEKIQRMSAVLAGHILYLSLGTAGMIWVGLVTMYHKINNKNQILEHFPKYAYFTFFIFIILSFAGTLILSTVSMEGADRLDHWMYGRHVESVIAPILLLGLLSRSYSSARLSVALAFVATLILYAWMGDYSHTAPFNVSTFWQEFILRDKGIWSWLVGGCLIIFIVSYVPRNIAQLVIGVFFILCISLQTIYHIKASKNAVKRTDVANYVRKNYQNGSCVGFDHSGVNSYNRSLFWYDLSFQLYDYRLTKLSVTKWLESCNGPLFSYSKNLHKRINAHPVAISGFGGPILWAKGDKITNNIYPLRIHSRSLNSIFVLDKGWHAIESNLVWSTNQSTLDLPIPHICNKKQCSAKINFSAFAASKARPVEVKFNSENNVSHAVTISDNLQHNVSIPLDNVGASLTVSITVPEATSPKLLGTSNDARILGIALQSIELVHESETD